MSSWKKIARRLMPTSLQLSIFCPKFINNRVKACTGMRVASGPFQGMHYIQDSVGSVLVPKLIGIYEHELHEVVEELAKSKVSTIIDIGAAEGYYAVGLAIRIPDAQVLAFEIEAEGRNLLAKLAEKNKVSDRIRILGECTVKDFCKARDASSKTAIVCDVEGAESFLLDPDQIPKLREASILVELHPGKSPGINMLLRQRFEASHDIQVIVQEPRGAADFPYQSFPINLFPKAYLENAVSEFRQPWEEIMNWFWMVPK
jgi:hypothetical protein